MKLDHVTRRIPSN